MRNIGVGVVPLTVTVATGHNKSRITVKLGTKVKDEYTVKTTVEGKAVPGSLAEYAEYVTLTSTNYSKQKV